MTSQKPDPLARMTSGYRQVESEIEARRRRKVASGFRESTKSAAHQEDDHDTDDAA